MRGSTSKQLPQMLLEKTKVGQRALGGLGFCVVSVEGWGEGMPRGSSPPQRWELQCLACSLLPEPLVSSAKGFLTAQGL